MEFFKDWAFSLAAGTLIATVIDALAPKGKTANALKLVTVLFLLLAIASPLMRLRGGDLKSVAAYNSTPALKSVEKDLKVQMLQLAGTRVKEQLTTLLRDKVGDGVQITALETDLDEAGNVLVRSVSVGLPEALSTKKELVKQLLTEQFSKDVKITIKVVKENG